MEGEDRRGRKTGKDNNGFAGAHGQTHGFAWLIRARPVVLKLKRVVVARIATFTDWPLILIDLSTDEGVVGRAYLEPYMARYMRFLVPALHDLGTTLKGRRRPI